MRAQIVFATPSAPVVAEVLLTLTIKEASVLYELGNYQRQIIKALDASGVPVSLEEIDATLDGLYDSLFNLGFESMGFMGAPR